MNAQSFKTATRRSLAGLTLAVAPALLAVGVAATSHASTVVPNPGPHTFAGQDYAGGVNGTNIKPGTPEHHRHQNHK
ncbi:hypothetical protein BH09ACT7_BH09ACT7_35650 [soil metagenome]